MGKKSGPPPGPSFEELLTLQQGYLDQNQSMFDDFQASAQTAYDDQKAINDQIMDIQIPAMEDTADLSQTLRDRYRNEGMALEDDYIEKATNWDSEERREAEAGRAVADIGQASDAARESELRRLESYGIDPSQTRSAALDTRVRLQDSANKAMAANNSRRNTEREGLAMQGEAMNIYQGNLASAGQTLAQATGAGGAASGAQGSTNATMYQNTSMGADLNSGGSSMLNSAYGTAGNMYGNDLKAYELKQEYGLANQLGQLAGAGIGMASMFSEGGSVPNRAEGGPGGPQGGQAPQGQQDQPPAAEPRPQSQGIPPENQQINVSPDEFIMPDDVAKWIGEKSLQNQINKARQERNATEGQRQQNQRALGIPA